MVREQCLLFEGVFGEDDAVNAAIAFADFLFTILKLRNAMASFY